MVIKYVIDGVEKKTHESNLDIKITEKDEFNHYIVMVKALKPLTLVNAHVKSFYELKNGDEFFLNGYQSWTDTHLANLKFKERDVKKIPSFILKHFGLDRYGDNHIYNYDKNHLHGFDLFYAKNYFCYNLNYRNAFLIFSVNKITKELELISDIKGKFLEENEEFMVFDFKYFAEKEKAMEAFNQDFSKKSKKIFGYTSWYNYYQDINEEIILRDLNNFDKRFDLFQIDDGYETFVGDWLDVDKRKFPNGLKPIVDKIHHNGLKAGLWLAPFVCETKSKTFQDHPDWIKKDELGNLALCGANWSGFYALDLENEEVKDYLKECFKHYNELGFDFYKLDFLYATNVASYQNMTNAMATTKYYQFLKDIIGDKLILGCGANMFQAYNLFDYMRIGPDVSLKFDDIWLMRHLHRERISTKVTLQNTIYRHIFDGKLFGNDPDVFLLRDNNMHMSVKNRHALITINSLFGSVFFTSDNLGDYDLAKKEELDKALNLLYNAKDVKFKKFNKKIIITYKLDNQEHLLVYNTKKGVLKDGKV